MKSWKIISLAGLIATGISIWSGPVQAQYYGGNIDQREAAQELRIREGLRNGTLTPQEAGRLEAEQQRIRAAEARMQADGRLGYRDRAALDRMQDNAGRHIYRQSHDNQVAYPGYRNQCEPRYQHRQDNQRQNHRQGNHYRRENGCDRRGDFRPNHGERSKFSGNHNRNRRFAWN